MLAPESRGVSRPLIGVAVFLAVVLIFLLSPFSPSPSDLAGSVSLPSFSKDASIPNVIHYVLLKKNADSELHLRFDHFLSVYASLIYFSPTTIFLHTDHNASAIAEAAVNGSKWTRKILQLPTVKTNAVVAPLYTNGTHKEIPGVEHKSDFVRIDELYRLGGIYLDLDVLPLRDIKTLRNAGFKTVVGRQLGGSINNGVILAQKDAALTGLMQREAPIVFDGGWETHSIKLITRISERLARFSGEVLIMDEMAFSPTNWNAGSVDALFRSHNDTPLVELAPQEEEEDDPIEWWDKRTEKRREWEMDLSQTYLLHAYKARGHDVPGFKGISVEYVQRRDSNYALAAWPVVRHALEAGLVEDGDDEI